MIRNLATVGGLTALSRLTGFGRDVVMAAALGAGPAADAFLVAFRLPNHFRAILAEGAFNAAFTPTYAALLERRGPSQADTFASRVMALLLLANAAAVAPMLLAPGLTLRILAPGLDPAGPTGALAAELLRLTAPYLVCLSVCALVAGALAARERFAAAAVAPVLLNLLMIGALLAASLFTSAAHAAAWGVLAAGVAQLLLMLAARRGGSPALRLLRPRLTPDTREFLRHFGPAVLAAGAVQLAMLADTLLARFLPQGALAHLYYADRLYQLPLGVIGVVAFPDWVVRFESWWMTGLVAVAGVAGEAAPDGGAGHEMTSGAGGR